MKEIFDVKLELENIDLVLCEKRDFVVPFAMTLEKNNLYAEVYSDGCEYGKEFINKHYGKWFSHKALEELRGMFAVYLNDHGYTLDDYGAYRYYLNFRRGDCPNENETALIKDSTCMYCDIGRDVPNITGLCCDDSDELPEESFVTVEDGVIVSVATVNDYSEDSDVVEITVETASKYRGKGYGVSNVLALTRYLTSRGKQVAYCCSKNNRASIKVARKCGFDEIGRMYAVCGFKDE